MTRHGIPLREYHLPKRVNPGIAFENHIPGVVTEYEAREASIYLGYTWQEWLGLHWFERASAVSHYRTHLAIQAHINDEIRIADERRARRKR